MCDGESEIQSYQGHSADLRCNNFCGRAWVLDNTLNVQLVLCASSLDPPLAVQSQEFGIHSDRGNAQCERRDVCPTTPLKGRRFCSPSF